MGDFQTSCKLQKLTSDTIAIPQGNIGEILKTSLNVFSIERLKMMFNENDFETTCQDTPDKKVDQKLHKSFEKTNT